MVTVAATVDTWPVVGDPVHMIARRAGRDVTARCGVVVRVAGWQSMRSVGVSSWWREVTCDGCLPNRSTLEFLDGLG